MKTITAQEHDLILAVRNEGLTELPPGVLEKDLLLTEVLQAINTADKDGIGLVFCVGTCLSKAHGLIDSMSEDIDFKLVVPTGLSRSARSRMPHWSQVTRPSTEISAQNLYRIRLGRCVR